MTSVTNGREQTLEVRQVSVRFEGLTAVDSVDETLHQGEILGLIGPNGAGKTTLVNAMTGFQLPSSGEVLLNGKVISNLTLLRRLFGHEHWIRRHGIGRTFQAGRLFRELPVVENVEVAAVSMGLGRKKARAHAMELLDWLGLSDQAEVPAGILPYTDERRVGIARALALSPEFVLLDEPAAGMSD